MKKSLSIFTLIIAFAASVGAECFDHTVWNKILAANVDSYGVVDFKGIRVNKGGGNFYEYLTFLEIAKLSGCSSEEKKSFWINAFNANVLRHLGDREDITKLTDDKTIFTKRVYVANKRINLNEIYHRILRRDAAKKGPIQGLSVAKLDPRIHFAISFVTLGSARLNNVAFSDENLDLELDWAAKEFINDPKHLRIENGVLVMSSLFNWYKKDFDVVGGVPIFIAKFLDETKRPEADEIKKKLETDFPGSVQFEFDWTINKK